jgi:allantoin racemase
MNLLLVNPNTTQAITDRLAAAARAAARRGTRIVAVTGRRGPAVIRSRADNAAAARECLALARAHAPGCDAILLGVSLDTALAGLRSRHRVPVIGMSEAGMIAASLLAPRFALLTFGLHMVPVYRELATGYGFGARLAGVAAVDFAPTAAFSEPAKVQAATLAECRALARRGAGAVVLAGAVFAGMRRDLQPRCALPLVDGIQCAVALAEAMHRLADR